MGPMNRSMGLGWRRIESGWACPLSVAAAAALVLLSVVVSGGGMGVAAMKPEAKCSACRVVAAELEKSLANERPRNHIDLRHRLDSKGQREGKVIDYRVSELRAVELLDGLCNMMKEYGLNPASSEKEWIKTGNVADNVFGEVKQKLKIQQKELQVFCERLLEETEDELSAGIRSGEFEASGSIEDRLCKQLIKQCPERERTSGQAEEVPQGGLEDRSSSQKSDVKDEF